jgi:superfamily I DNA and/or RNA helicase
MEIWDQLRKRAEDQLSESIRKYFAEIDVDLLKEIQELCNLSDIQILLKSFFWSYNLDDFFDEVWEIYNNSKIFEKTELYFYFYDISFQKTKYPLFFTPITLVRKDSEWSIAFDSPIYINRNAVDWILQEYNAITGKKWNIKSIEDRIIYINNIDNHIDYFNNILSELSHYFETDNVISLDNLSEQKAVSRLVSLSNNCYFTLFDKSDESIVNDYEEILTLAPDSQLTLVFEKLIDGFINKNPVNISSEVNEEWDNTDIVDRLVYQAPVPLNEEQRKALIALNNPDCSYLVIKGPPGTGKSHTITAIVCDYILNWKSVLMVSDKEEALDVVESKIADTLNSIRITDSFQNPIFRIWKNGNRFNQIVSGWALRDIKQHHQVFKQKINQLNANREEIEKAMRNDIEKDVYFQSQVSKEELEFMFQFEDEFPQIIETVSPEEVFDFEWGIDAYLSFINSIFQLRENLSGINIEIASDLTVLNWYIEFLESKIHILESVQALLSDIDSNLLKIEWKDRSSIEEVSEELKKIVSIQFWQNEFILKGLFPDRAIPQLTIDDLKILSLVYTEFNESNQDILDYGINISDEELGYFWKNITVDQINYIWEYIEKIETIRKPIVGFFFSKEDLKGANQNFRRKFPHLSENPHKDIILIKKLYDYFDFITDKKESFPILLKKWLLLWAFINKDTRSERTNFVVIDLISDFIEKNELGDYSVFQIVNWIDLMISKEVYEKNYENEILDFTEVDSKIQENKKMLDDVNRIIVNLKDIEIVENYFFNIPDDNVYWLIFHDFFSLWKEKFIEYATYLKIYQKYQKVMQARLSFFLPQKKQIEVIMTANMASVMDERIINFSEKNANDVQTLKNIIKDKKKFPRELFSELKNAFPCIIANIRTYSDFIPLEFEMFDLVIIDEASQVSIAQALPALFRAKKVIVLWDEKQFSNVKTSQASSETNTQYVKSLESQFSKNNRSDISLERLRKFNIKSSILDFIGSMKNYEVELRKHFRWYRELISFSNKHFYWWGLQVMKIRGKPISEVIEFTILDEETLQKSSIKNVNISEAEFIVSQIKKLIDEGSTQTVWIITPHTEQQRYIQKLIFNLPNKESILESFKLKVWTFDTCQWEERDIIIYSMVATKESDKLGYIFIKDLNASVIEEDKIKAQRLNVGFSRAKEKMWFILSKPVEDFNDGSIKIALQHYQNLLSEREIGEVDKSSPMESNVLNWILDSEFFNLNKDSLELIPQFNIGQYLKDLNPYYNHPKYKVDFLLLFKNEGRSVRIIIEYDGFKEHFTNLSETNASTFEFYQKDDDIYRQKVLESYGYIFLRLNKFNLGSKGNESETISERIKEIIDRETRSKSENIWIIESTINDVESYKNGKKKICPKCWELKDIEDFQDSNLLSWSWKYCMSCKTTSSRSSNRVTHQSATKRPSQTDKEKEDLIKNAISTKTNIQIYYKWLWRNVIPRKLAQLEYMGYSYYWLVAKDWWYEKNFSFDKIKEIKI